MTEPIPTPLSIWSFMVRLLTAIGALNWGLVALTNFDLVLFLFGSMPLMAKYVYAVVGFSGLLTLIYLITGKLR